MRQVGYSKLFYNRGSQCKKSQNNCVAMFDGFCGYLVGSPGIVILEYLRNFYILIVIFCSLVFRIDAGSF